MCIFPCRTVQNGGDLFLCAPRRLRPNLRAVLLLRAAAKALGVSVPPIYASPDVENAAVDEHGRVLYRPSFRKALFAHDPSGLTFFGVLAHELGHLIHDHHENPEGDPMMGELEADYVAGCAIGAVCENPRRFALVVKLLSTDFGSATHPPGWMRAQEITAGWRQCATSCGI